MSALPLGRTRACAGSLHLANGLHKDGGAKQTAHCDGALAEMLFVAFSVFVLLRVRWGSSICGGVLCAACETSRGKRLPDACSKNELRADLPDGL